MKRMTARCLILRTTSTRQSTSPCAVLPFPASFHRCRPLAEARFEPLISLRQRARPPARCLSSFAAVPQLRLASRPAPSPKLSLELVATRWRLPSCQRRRRRLHSQFQCLTSRHCRPRLSSKLATASRLPRRRTLSFVRSTLATTTPLRLAGMRTSLLSRPSARRWSSSSQTSMRRRHRLS